MKNLIKIIITLHFTLPMVLYSNNNAAENKNEFVVVIDAGHGGKDPGAIGKHGKEKDIALAISLMAGQYITENLKNVKVIYTRETDVFVPLLKRAEIANKNNAQLLLSIHVNSNNSSTPYGTSSHVLGLHRSQEKFEVAKKENSVILLEDDYETKYKDFDPNSPESYIIFSVMQNTYLKQSIEMAAMVQEQFKNKARRKDRGVEQQGLLVLAQCAMPGVLIETGFISNLKEEAYLMSRQGQEYMASAIYRAFKDYKKTIESKSNFSSYKTKDKDNNINIVPESVISESPKKINRKEEIIVKPVEEVSSNVKEQVIVKQEEKENTNLIDSVVVFRIQVSSSYAKLDEKSGFFKNVKNIDVYETDGLYKYVTGVEYSYEKIKVKLEEVKVDFNDAFIIAVKNKKIISLQQAFKETSLINKNIN